MMSIVRVIVVDPNPPEGASELLVYQVPEHSRAAELLADLLNKSRLEWVVLSPTRSHRRRKPADKGDTK